METIQVKDKKFTISITEQQIKEQIKRIASEIDRDFSGHSPLFLTVLNGAFIFAADLIREITIPCSISFVKLSSYEGTDTTGVVKEHIGLDQSIEGRDVIVVEDIIDTGLTMKFLLDRLKCMKPASLSVCTLLVKPEKSKVPLDIQYKCFEVPNDFILGYGLDYDGFGRNTKNIYTLTE